MRTTIQYGRIYISIDVADPPDPATIAKDLEFVGDFLKFFTKQIQGKEVLT